jgi:hypothetical protein
LVNSGVESNILVGFYCSNCKGSTQPTAFDFVQPSYSDWDHSWLGVALTSFDALFELNVELSAAANGELTLSLLTIPVISEDDFAIAVEFQVYLTANAMASMSFTAGLNLSVSSFTIPYSKLRL